VSARAVEPTGYGELLRRLKAEVRAAQTRARRVVNTELLTLYWTIGNAILERQATEGWGTRVIDRLADDLRAEFPDMRGLSRSNLKYMRQASAAWPGSIGQQPVGQLPWGHITVLLDKLDDQSERDWYAAKAAKTAGPAMSCSTRSLAACTNASALLRRTSRCNYPRATPSSRRS